MKGPARLSGRSGVGRSGASRSGALLKKQDALVSRQEDSTTYGSDWTVVNADIRPEFAEPAAGWTLGDQG